MTKFFIPPTLFMRILHKTIYRILFYHPGFEIASGSIFGGKLIILADWYKRKIKDSILNEAYCDKNRIINLSSPNVFGPQAGHARLSVSDPKHIYQLYLQAFKKGVYNYIKDDLDPLTQQQIPRKYFSGGVKLAISAITPAQSSIVPSKVDDYILSVNCAMTHAIAPPLIERKNTLPLKAYDLPEESFGVKSVNLINVFAYAWKEFAKDHGIASDQRLIIQPRGSVNYAVGEDGRLNWEDISGWEFAAYLPPTLEFAQKRDFGRAFMVKYLPEVMIHFGLRVVNHGVKGIYLEGKRNGRPYIWGFYMYPAWKSHLDIVAKEEVLTKLINSSWDIYHYQILSNYFELSADAKARPADLSAVIERISLRYLIENSIVEYKNVLEEAIEMFEHNRPKAFKRLAVAARLIGDRILFKELLTKFEVYSSKDRIFPDGIYEHPGHEFYEYEKKLNIPDQALELKIAGTIINEFAFKIGPEALLEVMKSNGGDISLGELVKKVNSPKQMAMKPFDPNTGGIDLSLASHRLQARSDVSSEIGIKFHLDRAMLQELEASSGLNPVIINSRHVNDIRAFLGISIDRIKKLCLLI